MKIQENPKLDLVLTDYQMPIINGLELVKYLRSSGYDTPVVILTGYGAGITVDPHFQPSGILSKPVRLQQLQNKLVEVMETSIAKRNA